jgi:non-ribosomal peptide synthetase-like protein
LSRRFWCGLAQAIALPFIFALVTMQWLGVFLASVLVISDETSFWTEMAILLVVFGALNLGTKALIVALKWLVIGRTKPGRYPLWGAYYFRIWLVHRLVQVTTLKFLQGSPLMSLYLRALGAKIGKDVVISEFEAGAIDLLTIEEHASTGLKVRFANVAVVGNEVIVGPVEIGRLATIGNGCVLEAHTRMEEGSELADLSVLKEGGIVPAYEHWDGSPSKKVGMAPLETELVPPTADRKTRGLQFGVYSLGYIVIVMLGLVPIFPAFYVLYNLESLWTGSTKLEVSWSNLPFFAWPTAAVLMLAAMAIVVVSRWIILPRRISEGTHSMHSWFYVRKWLLALVIEVTLETLNSLYATMYMRTWYRLMGCKIGKGTEISTNLAGRYDLVELGSNNFVGDEASLGDEEVRRGWMSLKRVRTGDRVFLGNDAVIPHGSDLADDTLIGVKSKMPDSLTTETGSTWFGSAAIRFPTRQRVTGLAGQTYQPKRSYLIGRFFFETFHTALPTALFITCGYIIADLVEGPFEADNYLGVAAIILAAGIVVAVLLILFAAAIKWILMGVYKPTIKPMWSWWSMRTEAVAVLYGGLVGKASMEFLRGTPFLPWALRLFGTKIGQGVWMDCTDLTEFDCVRVGDFTVLNDHAVLQTHLYEDRMMKVGRIEVGRGVSVGAGTTVLYDTEVREYARLRALTVVMKGDTIPSHTEWEGAPAVRAERAAPPVATSEWRAA